MVKAFEPFPARSAPIPTSLHKYVHSDIHILPASLGPKLFWRVVPHPLCGQGWDPCCVRSFLQSDQAQMLPWVPWLISASWRNISRSLASYQIRTLEWLKNGTVCTVVHNADTCKIIRGGEYVYWTSGYNKIPNKYDYGCYAYWFGYNLRGGK